MKRGLPMTKRLLWIDFLRGLAIFCVIWGHIDRTHHLFFMITSPFKIPLFFAITGFVFNFREGDIKSFTSNFFRTLVIPWFLLSLIWLRAPLALIRGNTASCIKLLERFISGKDFWFMPCCIIAEITFFLIRKFIRTVDLQYLAICLVSLIGIVMGKKEICRFMLMDVACTSMCFIGFGYWFKNNEVKIRKIFQGTRAFLPILLYFGLLFINYHYFQAKSMDIHMNKYFSYPFCFLLIFTSLFSLFILSKSAENFLVEKKGEIHSLAIRYIAFIGRNSLVYYLLHYSARKAWSKGLNILAVSLPKGLSAYIIEFVFVNLTMYFAAIILNNYFPSAVGKRHKKAIQPFSAHT